MASEATGSPSSNPTKNLMAPTRVTPPAKSPTSTSSTGSAASTKRQYNPREIDFSDDDAEDGHEKASTVMPPAKSSAKYHNGIVFSDDDDDDDDGHDDAPTVMPPAKSATSSAFVKCENDPPSIEFSDDDDDDDDDDGNDGAHDNAPSVMPPVEGKCQNDPIDLTGSDCDDDGLDGEDLSSVEAAPCSTKKSSTSQHQPDDNHQGRYGSNAIEDEVIVLGEQSLVICPGGKKGYYNWKYIEQNASPALKAKIQRTKPPKLRGLVPASSSRTSEYQSFLERKKKVQAQVLEEYEKSGHSLSFYNPFSGYMTSWFQSIKQANHSTSDSAYSAKASGKMNVSSTFTKIEKEVILLGEQSCLIFPRRGGRYNWDYIKLNASAKLKGEIERFPTNKLNSLVRASNPKKSDHKFFLRRKEEIRKKVLAEQERSKDKYSFKNKYTGAMTLRDNSSGRKRAPPSPGQASARKRTKLPTQKNSESLPNPSASHRMDNSSDRSDGEFRLSRIERETLYLVELSKIVRPVRGATNWAYVEENASQALKDKMRENGIRMQDGFRGTKLYVMVPSCDKSHSDLRR